jgi:hypothetical protein
MKKIISFEIELNDEYVKDWEANNEGPIEKILAEEVKNYLEELDECVGEISIKYTIEDE